MDPRIDTEFAGHRIEKVIGRGGASVVYLAEHLRLGRKVALKLLAPHLAEDADFRERFIRESRIAGGLDHPNIVTIYDAGEVEDCLYISMRYVEGRDLDHLLRAQGTLETSRMILILSQVSSALDKAHVEGLVHRDVKPANVLVETAADGVERAYLSDFGISKHTATSSGITRTGQFVGTVDYVAPEQISGQPIDGRTDVYSLGCVLFRCLAGRVPYPAQMEVATIYKHLHDPPPSLDGIFENAEALDGIIAKALAKSKEDRYPTCGTLIEAVHASLGGTGIRNDLDVYERRGLPSSTDLGARPPAVESSGIVCTSCGQTNAVTATSCSGCGSSLRAEMSGPDMRKVVTVLFCDVAGSTALGERLDPESLRTVMSRFFERVKAVLESHGGTVERFIGDAVMAIFGIPSLHEDDALRACRAAIQLQADLGHLNEELERDWDVTLTIRTALSTGEVIAGDPSSGRTLVTGDPVNTAARLEQAAAGGEVLIGEATYRLVRDFVDVETVELVEGEAISLPAYRLLSTAPGIPTRALRLDSPLVARDDELRTLHEAFEHSLSNQTCMLATVVGAPGVGKSRLAHEFVDLNSSRATVLQGRCLPYGEGITLWPVSEVIRQAAGIRDGDSPEDGISRIDAMLPDTEDRPVIRDRVAAAVGLGDAVGPIQETFWAVRKVLEALAAQRQIIVVFEDIHWAEPTFLDLIEYLHGWSKSSPILLLCLTRPELLEARPEWASLGPQAKTVSLEPLGDDDSARLIQNLLDQRSFPSEIASQISGAAEGNPLFVEEMLGMLIDEEILRYVEDRWIAVGDVSSVPSPPSIQGLLATRVERLPEEQRAVLQRAAVVGKAFWWSAIADLSSATEGTRVDAHLQALVRKGLIQPDESVFRGQDAFQFRHILICDAAYRSIPRATRADLHERFAGWLETMVGERIEEYEEILGYHLERAYWDKVVPSRSEAHRELATRASDLLASAGRRALNREDINAAVGLLSRASRLGSLDGRDSFEIRLSLADALCLSDELPRAREELNELIAQARGLTDEGLEWRARILLGETILLSSNSDSFDSVRSTADRAIELFSQLGDEWGLSRSWQLLAFLHLNVGRAKEAQKANARAAFHARSAGDVGQEMRRLINSARNAALGPTPVEETLALFDEILDRASGQPGHEAAIYVSRGPLEAMRGNFDVARAVIAHGRSILQELGAPGPLAEATDYAADVEWYAGDLISEERERRAGYEAYRAMGAIGYQVTWAAWLARSLVDLGRDDEALDLTRESQELAYEDDITAQVPWRAVRATILARRGVSEEAQRLAHESVMIAERTDWLNLRGDALMYLAEVVRLGGKAHEAAEAARQAAERYETKGNVVRAALARSLLQQLSGSAPP